MKTENTLSVESPAIKIVVAAEAGNGKTTLAKTLGEPVLVISAEAGLLSLRGSNIEYLELQTRIDEKTGLKVEVPKAERIARLLEIFHFVQQPETRARFKWLFIDSLTEVNQNMLEFLETQEDFQGPKNTIKKFGELASRMRGLCKAFRDLPHYSIVFSALVKEDTNEDNKTVVKIDMTGKFAAQLPALFDEIFYLGVMSDVGEDGRNQRQILTQKTDRFSFPKDRSGRLARTEPADLAVIVKKIRTEPLVENISEKAKAAAAESKKAQAEESIIAGASVSTSITGTDAHAE